LSSVETVRPADIPLPGPVAGVVGQFNSRTDLAMLDAVRAAGTSLLLVGPRWFVTSEDDETFDRLVRSAGVHWVDGLPREELAPYLAALDVGLTPYADSMFNARSYPLKTLEYLAAGVPVVSTEVAPLDGLDRDFVSAESDLEAFCERVAKVAASPADRAEVRRSVQDSGWQSRAAHLLALLGSDLDHHSPAPNRRVAT
jgi:glycosyltransferase involved in cell wall biosynthesis